MNAFDAQNNSKKGLLYRDGRYLVPCVFDYVDNNLCGPAMVYLDYVGFRMAFYDEPFDEGYKIGDNLYENFHCHGLKTSHMYSESPCVPLYSGEPMTDDERRAYVKRVAERVYS